MKHGIGVGFASLIVVDRFLNDVVWTKYLVMKR